MKLPRLLCVLIVGYSVASCGLVRSSYHAATAPIRMVRGGNGSHPPPTDVTNPGHPIAPSPTPTAAKKRATRNQPVVKASPSPAVPPKTTAAAKTPPANAGSPQFPTAKPVPNKPGYVFSPSDPGKYVDVSGYAPGSKVKDPYSGKIFLVP